MPTPITPDLAELKRKAEAATPGPYHTGGTAFSGPYATRNVWGPTPTGMQSGAIVAKDLRIPDASYLEALDPQTVLALIAAAEERDRLAGEVAGLREMVRRCHRLSCTPNDCRLDGGPEHDEAFNTDRRFELSR